MKNLLKVTVLMSLLFVGCRSQEDRYLEEALKAAGNNRAELESVLEHYTTDDPDPLKLEAARYLIMNMPGHYSYRNTEAIDEFYDQALEILGKGTAEEQRDSIRKIGDTKYARVAQDHVPDVEVVTSDYLIHNIDKVFEQWKSQPWSRHLTFEEVRDWILPYKVTELQSFDAWREILPKHYTDSLYRLPENDVKRNTIYGALDVVRDEIHARELDMKFVITWKDRNGLPLLDRKSVV